MNKNYDFCGWATRNDLLCSDGRIIRRDAFKHNDGDKVPLIWNHDHSSPSKLVGHCILQNRPEGVYTYGYLNNSKSAQEAKEGLLHGDIDSLSIYANHLTQNGSEVLHGSIKEVSLVLAGANPGARIENVIEHMDGCEEEAIITTGDYIELYHADESEKTTKEESKEEESKAAKDNDKEKTVKDVIDTMTEEQKTVMYAVVGAALEEADKGKGGDDDDDKEKEVKHADDDEDNDDEDNDDETVKDVIDSMTDKQKTVMYAVVGAALEEASKGNKKTKNNEDEGDEDEMKHNLFEGTEQNTNEVEYLSHSDMEAIFNDAKETGSLKNAVLRHGITNIEYMFPANKNVENVPGFIKRNTEWVDIVLNGVHHTPFSRIRSLFADLTEAEARAKGYIKGHQKADEVFGMLRRRTNPTMIYKKQKIDRQDMIEITDFDIVAWLKSEMRIMLNEEIARAILVGDGRSTTSEDKIDEECIRPIWTDNDTYTIHKTIEVAANATEDDIAKAMIRGALKARKDYKGAGNPILFTTEDYLTNMLLMEDQIGRPIYDTEEKLQTAMRVSKIVTVPVMENLTRTVSGTTRTLAGIIVNLDDYNVGADKGGEVNMFDDFDIDYNAQKYLIETHCSGAMIKPYSAIALEIVVGE